MTHAHAGPYTHKTGDDHVPLSQFGGAAGRGAIAVDHSSVVNVDGANTVAANAEAEAREIAAVPDPQSPAGQAAILAIIQKYQAMNAGAVEGAATDQQANGAHAAGDHHHDRDDDDSRGGSGLMDILSQLLGSGGSGVMGMNPFGQGMSPFNQGMSPGSSPFGEPQQVGATAPAANPFSDPLAAPPATAAAYNPANDPFAANPSGGGGPTAAVANPNAAPNPFTPAGAQGPAGGAGGGGAPVVPATKPGSGPSGAAAVDLDAFGGAEGGAVPADPGATGTGGT